MLLSQAKKLHLKAIRKGEPAGLELILIICAQISIGIYGNRCDDLPIAGLTAEASVAN